MSIRPVREGDRDEILALHRAAIRSAGSDPDDVPGNEDLDTPVAAYRGVGGELLVLEAEGDIVAMGGYKPRDSGVELLRMAVAPDAQGEGYGSRIIEALEAHAREAGYEHVELETTARQEQAMGFYPSHGYHEAGRRQDGEYEVVRFEKSL
ncbi:GNAT family N-acetyltransferase [Halosegnis longus]|uniref:GNAT family N-acetyltransferase n=1 Tax=Halosegnis longus TaxID=2216012 RepID=UPI001561CFCD|nr:GNAT family N-acetyltransferase [Halosegnis longus]